MSSQIVGTLEIAQLLSVSRQRADQLTKTDPLFPPTSRGVGVGQSVGRGVGPYVGALPRTAAVDETQSFYPAMPHDAVRRRTDAARLLLASPTKKSAQRALQEALDGLEAVLTPFGAVRALEV